MIEVKNSKELSVLDFAGVSAIITDPPYGIGLASHCKRGVNDRKADYSIQGDDSQEIGEYILKLAREAKIPTIAFFASPQKPWGGKFRNWIVWDKGGGTGFGGDTNTCLRRTWELIQVENQLPMNGREESVWRMPPNNAIYKDHPCAKPVSLIKKILTVFNVQGTVIDPFAGSGSVGVACAELGIKYKGYEIDENYAKKGNERITKQLEQRNLL